MWLQASGFSLALGRGNCNTQQVLGKKRIHLLAPLHAHSYGLKKQICPSILIKVTLFNILCGLALHINSYRDFNSNGAALLFFCLRGILLEKIRDTSLVLICQGRNTKLEQRPGL